MRAIADRARLIRLPVYVGDELGRVRRTAERIRQRTGRKAAHGQLAIECGLGREELRNLLALPEAHVSLDAPLADSETHLAELIESTARRIRSKRWPARACASLYPRC
ncbi:RNA polymerase sigma factor RpoD [compost metagenome]